MTVADETLSHYQIGADPFTEAELTAIAEYRDAINGIRDMVEGTQPRDLKSSLGAGLEAPGARHLLTHLANGLNTWYLALDTALADLLTCTTESTTYSVAAKRFLGSESGAYHQARQEFEYAVTVFALGLPTGPTGNYPPLTVALNLPMQSLAGYDG
jgi:hypothetical protein